MYPSLSSAPTAEELYAYRGGKIPGEDKRRSIASITPQDELNPSPPRNNNPSLVWSAFATGPMDSVRVLVAETSTPLPEIDEGEMEDLHVISISEVARPGKPRLDRILADEVERSRGAIAVACCGPTSLNAVVRKIVAVQNSPSRVFKSDMRGMISLVTEDFER